MIVNKDTEKYYFYDDFDRSEYFNLTNSKCSDFIFVKINLPQIR